MGRNLFPDTSTRELQRLGNWSIPIEAMSMLWGVFFVFAVLAFLCNLNESVSVVWGRGDAAFGPARVGRLGAHPLFWACDLLLDAAFALALLWAALRLATSICWRRS